MTNHPYCVVSATNHCMFIIRPGRCGFSPPCEHKSDTPPNKKDKKERGMMELSETKMKRYTEKLREMLGIIVYGVAQVYDVPLDEVMTEVLIIVDTPWRRPAELFQSSTSTANSEVN